MPSKGSLTPPAAVIKFGGLFLMLLSVIFLITVQIWLAPHVFTVGLALIFRQWIFRKSPTEFQDFLAQGAPDHDHEPLSGAHAPHAVTFWNFPMSRIVIIITIVFLAIIDAAVFRTPLVDRFNPIGSWQILMGPTLFYPLVFLPLLMAVGMSVHLLFTIRKITLSRVANMLIIHERGVLHFSNQIDLDEVIDSHFCSNTTGLKALWLIPWSIQIWGNFASAWHYLTNEFTFGTGIFIGPTYLAHSFIYFIVLILLLFTSENELRWETSSQECYLRWYSPSFSNTIPSEQMLLILNINSKSAKIENSDQGKSESQSSYTENWQADLKKMNYYLQLGVFLFILPFISIAIPFFFNDVVRIFLFLGAIAAFGVSLKDMAFKYPRRNFFRYVYFTPISSKSAQISKPLPNVRPSSLTTMLYISEMAQLLSIGIILTTKWRLYPILQSSLWVIWCDLLASTVLGIFLVWLYGKHQWQVLGERNRVIQVGEFIFLSVGIMLSFIL